MVGVPSFERFDFRRVELPVLEGVCCERLDCAVAVGEQGRAPGVVDDVPGFGRFDLRGREPGGGDVVVVVVLVPLRNEADVEEPEDVAVRDDDMAAVARGVQTQEATLFDVRQNFARRSVEGEKPAVVGDDQARL